MLLSAPLLSATKPLRCPMQLSSSGSRTSEGLLHEFCFMFLNTCVVHESSSTNSGKCFSDNKPNDCLRKGRSSWSPKWVLKANQAVVGCCASLMYVCVCIYIYIYIALLWRLSLAYGVYIASWSFSICPKEMQKTKGFPSSKPGQQAKFQCSRCAFLSLFVWFSVHYVIMWLRSVCVTAAFVLCCVCVLACFLLFMLACVRGVFESQLLLRSSLRTMSQPVDA